MKASLAGGEDQTYRFGDYRLLPSRQLLLRGEQPIRVGSRALDLLRLLVERHGELISKAELIRFAWPDTFVQEENLKVNIAALRRALARPGSEEPFIATVPGRGYRFVAAVRLERVRANATPAAILAVRDGLPGTPGLFGREDDIAHIADMLDWRRFVTIVGPAGVGKTTVAVSVARQAAREYPDGVCFIDFAAIGDPRLVTAAVASGIGLGGNLKDLLIGLVDALRGQRKLLILDNCEHVLNAAALLAEHLRTAVPDVAIIATSREPFRSRAETVYRLQPLACPAQNEDIDSCQAMTFPAVALFAARAGEVAGYQINDADAPVVVDICRRLDGIPLAIELAVPRLLSCDAATVLALLEQNFALLSYGPAHAPLRQQTLLATLDWSYRLLSDDEAGILRLLAVFAGTFTLGDAVGIAHHLGRSPEEVGASIEGLVGKSLLSSSFSEAGLQYRLLDATRGYALGRLRSSGEYRRAGSAHAAHLLELFARAESEWQWRVREDWTDAYGRHANDLRKALDWAFGEGGDPMLGIRLTAFAIPLWDELSSVGESGRHVRRALESAEVSTCEPAIRMKLATAHAWSLTYAERFEPEGEAAWREGLRLAELTGDADYQLRTLWGLASLQCFHGQHRQALASLSRFEAIAERENDRSAAPTGERLRVLSKFYLGHVRAAHEDLKRLARRYDSVTRRPRISRFHIDWYVGIRKSLSLLEWICGHPNEAAATAQVALDVATAMGHVVSQSDTLALAVIPIALWTGRIEAAERHLVALRANLNQRHLALWEPLVRFYEGAVRYESGDDEGVGHMRAALADLVEANFVVRVPIYLAMLGEAALRRGRMEVARESVAAALGHLECQEEFWCRPEVLRVLGLLKWHDGDAEGAEQTLLLAVRAAHEAGSLAFELRAALSLADRWARAGRPAAATALLDPICRRFDAAAESRDVATARQLLRRLHTPAGIREHDVATEPRFRDPCSVRLSSVETQG